MKILPTSLEPVDAPTRSHLIPKVIYQTWKSNNLTDYLHDCAYTWISKNPDYRYEFFDDARLEKFVHDFDCSDFTFTRDDMLRAFNSYAHPVGKADIWRYFVIYANGGVYMDIDTKCATPLSKYVDDTDTYVTGIDPARGIHQWGIIMSAKHPFMKHTIENAIKCTLTRTRVPGTEKENNNLEIYTGPWVMNYSIKKLLNIRPERHFGAGTFIVKIEGSKYRIKILPKPLMNGHVIFDHERYLQNLRDHNIPYWSNTRLWK